MFCYGRNGIDTLRLCHVASYQDRIIAAIDEAGSNLKSSQAQPTCSRAGALDAAAGLAQNKSLLGGVLVVKI